MKRNEKKKRNDAGNPCSRMEKRTVTVTIDLAQQLSSFLTRFFPFYRRTSFVVVPLYTLVQAHITVHTLSYQDTYTTLHSLLANFSIQRFREASASSKFTRIVKLERRKDASTFFSRDPRLARRFEGTRAC